MEKGQGTGGHARPDTSGLETVPGTLEMAASAPAASVDSPRVPTHVGRYVIIERIGAGGMGVVYAAYDPELDRKVAVKVLQPHRKAADAKTKMIREAQAMARLSHPNVVPVYDAGPHEEGVFIAMEFVVGGTLGQWQRNRGSPNASARDWREVLEVYRGAALGLAAAHDAGLIHRDFKPDNVLLAEDGRPQVVDFGLARAAKGADTQSVLSTANDELIVTGRHLSGDSAITRSAGTPAYMAPEQFELRVPDARADQFSLCVALWEALYGERPWPATGVGEQFAMMIEQPLPTVPSRTQVPRWVGDALTKGLSLDPEQRHADMRALISALDFRRAARWRRWAMAAGAVGVLVAIVAGVRVTQARACTRAETQVDELWNDARAQRGRAAFEASGVVGNEEAWAHIRKRLDDYAAEWRGLRRASCSATGASSAQTQQDLDRQVICLERRLVEFDALLGALEHPDEVIVRKGVQATSSLGSLGLCRDPARLRQAVPWPTEKHAAAKADAVWQHIQQSHALEALGKFEEGLVVAEDAAAMAEDLGHPPLEIEARLMVGSHLGHLQRHDEAYDVLKAVYFDALAHQADELALKASIGLVDTAGVRLREFDIGTLWAESAEALLARTGGSSDSRARLAGSRAGIHYRKGEFDEAQALILEAIAIAEADGNDIGRWTYQSNLGAVLRRLGRFEEALEVQREALKESETLFGADSPVMIGDYGNIGNTLSDLGRGKEALFEHQKALDLSKKYYPGNHSKVASALLNLGATSSSLGDLHDCLARFEQASAMLTALHGEEHVTVQRALQNLALTRFELGDAEGAIALQEQILARRPAQLGESHPELGRSYVTRATMLRGLGESERAVVDARKAIEILRETYEENHGELNWPFRELAYSLRMQGDLEGARAALGKARASVGDSPQRLASTSLLEAEFALLDGDAALARQMAAKATELTASKRPDSLLVIQYQATKAHALWASGQVEEARAVATAGLERAGTKGFAPNVDYRLHAVAGAASEPGSEQRRDHQQACAASEPKLNAFDRGQMAELTKALSD